jgi:uncharacterized phiE125 gp8 family phage protein
MSLRPSIPLYQHRGHVLVTPPAAEPVTAEELREHLAFDSADTAMLSDYMALGLIEDARTLVEQFTGLALVNQTWRLSLDVWPAVRDAWWDGVRQMSAQELYSSATMRSLDLPRSPLVSVVSCTVFDEASNSAAVDIAGTFDIDTDSMPGRLTLRRGATWPIALRANNAIQIVYVAGYGDASENVPGPLKRAVKHLAAFLHEHRGDNCSSDEAIARSGAGMFLNAYKVARL